MNKRARELFEQANYDIMLEERKLEIINEFNEYHNALIISTVEQLFEYRTLLRTGVRTLKRWGPKGAAAGGMYLSAMSAGASPVEGDSLANSFTGTQSRQALAAQSAERNNQSAQDAVTGNTEIDRSGQYNIQQQSATDRQEASVSKGTSLQKARDLRNRSIARQQNIAANNRELGISRQNITSHYVADVAKDVVKLLESEFDVAYDKQIIEQVIHIINENIDHEYVSLIMEMRKNPDEITDPKLKASRKKSIRVLHDFIHKTKDPKKRARAIQALGTTGVSAAPEDFGKTIQAQDNRNFEIYGKSEPEPYKTSDRGVGGVILSPVARQLLHPSNRNKAGMTGRNARELTRHLGDRINKQSDFVKQTRKAMDDIDPLNPKAALRKVEDMRVASPDRPHVTGKTFKTFDDKQKKINTLVKKGTDARAAIYGHRSRTGWEIPFNNPENWNTSQIPEDSPAEFMHIYKRARDRATGQQ